MAFDLIQAKQQLADLIKGAYTTGDLLNLVRQVDIAAEGSVTVLYSGEVDGVKTSVIAEGMASEANIRIIDKTAASKLLASNDFAAALGATKGLSLDQMRFDSLCTPDQLALKKDLTTGSSTAKPARGRTPPNGLSKPPSAKSRS